MSLFVARRWAVSSVASSSRSAVPVAAAFHSSPSFGESAKARTARITRKSNLERKEVRNRKAAEVRPHVVLGARPGDEAKWSNCDLAKTLLTRAEINQSTPEKLEGELGDLDLPKHFSYGLNSSKDTNAELLFEHLPYAAVEDTTPDALQERLLHAEGDVDKLTGWDRDTVLYVRNTELRKASQLARAIDLRNANAKGIAFENRQRIMTAFSPSPEEPSSGYPEVQAALLTLKIRSVWDHLIRCKKDLTSRRALRRLVHQRAKTLKYIKRLDRDRYDRILERLALEPGSVEGELVI